MKIAVTKKLADVIGIKPLAPKEEINPLFYWTANWTNIFDGCKEDLVVMVNAATSFTVTIYGVKWNQFKNITEKMVIAIRNTLMAMNLNAEMVDEYLQMAGDVEFVSNHDRKQTSRVNRLGLEAAFVIGNIVNKSAEKLTYDDSFGRIVSRCIVDHKPGGYSIPSENMVGALAQLTGKPAYKYTAYELMVTLDLDIYQASRRLIVPAVITFDELHCVIQSAFGWENRHLYDFTIFDDKGTTPVVRLVPDVEGLEFDDLAQLTEGTTLSAYLPEHKKIHYTYDMGDNWEHEVALIRVIEDHDEAPYLLEASGQTPPEDVGGVSGFKEFRRIMLDPTHPDFQTTKAWAGYWGLELSDWESRPRELYY